MLCKWDSSIITSLLHIITSLLHRPLSLPIITHFSLPNLQMTKVMTQTLPVATYLHRINQTKHSPCCTDCSQDGSEKDSLSHFFSICPKLEQQRIIKSVRFLRLPCRNISLFHETPLRRAGLVLELVPTESQRCGAQVRQAHLWLRRCSSRNEFSQLATWLYHIPVKTLQYHIPI